MTGGKGKAGCLPHMRRNAEGLGAFAVAKALRELENAELAAYAHVLLDIGHGNLLHALGEILQEFFRLYGDFAEVRSGAFRQEEGRLGMDAEAPAFVIRLDLIGFEDQAVLRVDVIDRFLQLVVSHSADIVFCEIVSAGACLDGNAPASPQNDLLYTVAKMRIRAHQRFI